MLPCQSGGLCRDTHTPPARRPAYNTSYMRYGRAAETNTHTSSSRRARVRSRRTDTATTTTTAAAAAARLPVDFEIMPAEQSSRSPSGYHRHHRHHQQHHTTPQRQRTQFIDSTCSCSAPICGTIIMHVENIIIIIIMLDLTPDAGHALFALFAVSVTLCALVLRSRNQYCVVLSAPSGRQTERNEQNSTLSVMQEMNFNCTQKYWLDLDA